MSIKSFQDLHAWQKGHSLVLAIYEITNKFPKQENFALIDQLRRAAVSITSNIAEGFPKRTSIEKIHYYRIALGSLAETENQMIIAKDIKYIAESEFNKISQDIVEESRLINGLIKSAKSYT